MTEEAPLTKLPKYSNAKLIGADFAAEFFPDASVVEVRLTLLEDMWHEIQSLCAENGWSLELGSRIVLANGVNCLKERSAEGTQEARPSYLDLAGQYAVMKFRTFQFMQAAQMLDMKINALRSELDSARKANENLRAELERRGAAA